MSLLNDKYLSSNSGSFLTKLIAVTHWDSSLKHYHLSKNSKEKSLMDVAPQCYKQTDGMGWISPGGVSYRAPYGTKKYFIGNQNIDTWVLQLGTFLCQQISRLDLNQIYSGVIMIYIYLSLSGVALLSSLFTFCWNFRMSNTRNG